MVYSQIGSIISAPNGAVNLPIWEDEVLVKREILSVGLGDSVPKVAGNFVVAPRVCIGGALPTCTAFSDVYMHKTPVLEGFRAIRPLI